MEKNKGITHMMSQTAQKAYSKKNNSKSTQKHWNDAAYKSLIPDPRNAFVKRGIYY